MNFSRRDFLASTALTSASLALTSEAQQSVKHDGKTAQKMDAAVPNAKPAKPVIICKPSGMQSMDAAHEMLSSGRDTLDAVLHVCKGQEDDPNDDSVGLADCPTRMVWSSSTPAACTALRDERDQSAACATSRMYAWWRVRSWSTPAT